MIRIAVKFGLFTALTLAVTVVLAIQIQKIQLGATYEIKASFADVSGLFEGDDVKIAGVKVGQVSSIKVASGRAVITLSLDGGTRIPEDSGASVRWRNLIGQRIVYLHPGESDKMLPDGALITDTRAVVDIGELINRLGGLTSTVDAEQLNQLVLAIGQALEGNQQVIDDLLLDAGSLLTTLADRDDTIAGLIDDAEVVTSALAERDTQIGTMIENLALLSEALTTDETLVDRALVELAGYTDDLDKVLVQNEDELSSIVANLAVVTDTLSDEIDVVDAQLAAFPGALDGLHRVTNRGEFIVISALCFSTGPPPCPTPVGNLPVAPLDTPGDTVDSLLALLDPTRGDGT